MQAKEDKIYKLLFAMEKSGVDIEQIYKDELISPKNDL